MKERMHNCSLTSIQLQNQPVLLLKKAPCAGRADSVNTVFCKLYVFPSTHITSSRTSKNVTFRSHAKQLFFYKAMLPGSWRGAAVIGCHVQPPR